MEESDIPMDKIGHLESGTTTAAFDIYGTMYAHIKAIRFQDGTVLKRY